MALYYLAGFDCNETPMAVVVAGPGSGTATVTTSTYPIGTYCYTSLVPVLGTSYYADFAAALQSALNAVVAGFTVVWSSTTYLFTISHTSTFSLTFTGTSGTNLQRALGITTNVSGTNSYTSTVRPYYVIVPTISGRSSFTDVYESNEIVEEAVSDGGTPYGVAQDTNELYCDWMQQCESKEATLLRAAVVATPWTWEHFVKHCRAQHPFLVVDGASQTVHKLRAESASFNDTTRARVTLDYDDLWNLNFRTRDLGAIEWTPSLLTNLRAWYRSDLGITLDGGDEVVSWADQSGNGHTLTAAASGNQPDYDVDAGPNSVPTVKFVRASSHWLRNTTFDAGATVDDHAVFVVCQLDATTNGQYIHRFSGVTAQRGNGSDLLVSYGPGLGVASTGTTSMRTDWRSIVSYGDGATQFARVDGAIEDSDANASTAAATGTLALGATHLGAEFADVSIVEFVWMRSTPTTAELAAWDAYVNARYGL